MRTRIGAAVALIAVTVLVPGTATAEPAPAAAADVRLTAKCAEQMRQEAATYSSRTTAWTTACVDVRPAGDARVAAPTECGIEDWQYTRFTGCTVNSYIIFAVRMPQQIILGYINYNATSFVSTNANSGRWTLTTELQAYSMWGVMTGTKVEGSGSCTPQCSASMNFPPQSFTTLSSRAVGENTLTSSVTGTNPVNHAAKNEWWFTNPSWTPPRTNGNTATPGNVRCDAQFATVGCTFPVRPKLSIPSNNPSYNSFALHVRMALDYGLPRVLTRITDPLAITDNGNRACPGYLPRPAFYQCDEYPFRSTREGAYTGNHPYGRTFAGCQIGDPIQIRQPGDSLGWSICMIPEEHNRLGGDLLWRFYQDNRVLNGERFTVVVV